MKLKCSSVGVAWEISQTAFAVIVSGLYVIQTYDPAMNTDTFDLAALVVFSSDYLLNLYCCDNRCDVVCVREMPSCSCHDHSRLTVSVCCHTHEQVQVCVDVHERHGRAHDRPSDRRSHHAAQWPQRTAVLALHSRAAALATRATAPRSRLALDLWSVHALVCRYVHECYACQWTRSHALVFVHAAVHKQIQTIVLLLASIVFIAAGIFHAVESDNRSASDPTITFGEALYFLLVTLATVGYGDIAPLTSSGKAVAAGVIIIAFTVIPRELSRLNQLMALQSQFRKVYRPAIGNPHILIVGHVSEPRCLLDFFRELYHPDRLLENGVVNSLTDLPSVIMGPEEPSEGIVHLLDHPMLQGRVTYIKGSVMSEEDLCRVGTDIARACFVLVSKSSADTNKTDQETVLRLLAVRNYNPELEIFTQIVSSVHAEYISDKDADHVLCLDQIKLSLMAKSTLCPGLVTLISNLFQSSGIASTKRYEGWEKEYIAGLALEIYATALPPAFFGLSFSQACDVLYRISRGEIILLGVYEANRNGHGDSSPTHSPQSSPPASPTKKRSGRTLPALKVRPVLKRHNSRYRSAPGSTMMINPGSTMSVGVGQIFYVMSESKKLAQTSSILELLAEWQRAGNELPLPRKKPPTTSSGESSVRGTSQSSVPVRNPLDHDVINVRVARRSSDDIVIQDTSSAVLSTAGAELNNHIVVVSDLDYVAMETFIRMLRLARHRPGDDDYHAIVFVSWSTKSVSLATRVLQEYDDVFLMLATGDSKTELLRADVLSARACVLLADRSAIQHLDGEVIDGKTIFHYLAILSIQDELGVGIASTFVPLVELTVPRTMKILDMEMKKRLRATLERTFRQLQLRGAEHARDRDDLVRVVESENNRQQQLLKSRRESSKNIVKHMYAHGASNISSLETHFKLQQRVQYRRSLIRRQQALIEQAYFESGGASVLPFFAAGYGFSVDIFDNILCQSFFTPGLIRFLYELLFSDNGQPATRDGSARTSAFSDVRSSASATDSSSKDKDASDVRIASSLVQIPVPMAFVTKTFGALFTHLIVTEDIVAIGLYRRRGIESVLPYVAAGPAMDTTLEADDMVFVLAQPAALKRMRERERRARPAARAL